MLSRLFCLYSLDWSISSRRDVWLVFFVTMFYRNSNSVDPDQAPRFVASDLDQHYLVTSILWDAMQNG